MAAALELITIPIAILVSGVPFVKRRTGPMAAGGLKPVGGGRVDKARRSPGARARARSKQRLGSRSRRVLLAFGVVSPQVAKEMAHRANKLLGADICFAITGLKGTPENEPRGVTCLAAATPEDRTLLRRHAHDHGAGRNRERVVRTSLLLIQSSLAGEPTR